MEHVNTYMSIEKLRFGEDLDFSVITPVTDFLLPALTLQPLVENAVRHGIVPTGREGIILITTRETEQHYVISISDNGMGFDIKSLDTDEGKHIGIRNVRERLKMQMNASLEISSIPGSGTEVTVRIPKQNRYAENSDRQVKI
jgi:sensor histidine kinase YesM